MGALLSDAARCVHEWRPFRLGDTQGVQRQRFIRSYLHINYIPASGNRFDLAAFELKVAIAFASRDSRYDHKRQDRPDICTYNQIEGYVIFSAMGSFFIPMTVMVSNG